MDKPVIQTERLILRPLALKDLEDVAAYATDPENTTYMMFLPFDSVEETADYLREAEAQWTKEQPGFYEFAVLREGALVGAVTLYFEEPGFAELGWVIRKEHWRQGYAYEAASALMQYAREVLGYTKFVAHCDGENAPSYRVMEKLGMTRVSDSGRRKNRGSDEERVEYRYERIFS